MGVSHIFVNTEWKRRTWTNSRSGNLHFFQLSHFLLHVPRIFAWVSFRLASWAQIKLRDTHISLTNLKTTVELRELFLLWPTFITLLVNNERMSFCSLSFFLGVGYAQVISTGIVATYYVTIMAITLHYFFNSFKAILPWTECLPEWGNTCTPSSRDTAFKYIKQSLVNRSSSAELYYE